MNPQASGEASTFVLQSTVPGRVAAVGGPFPATLLAGLRGKGRAKAWDNRATGDAMVVRYDTLRSYLKSSLVKDQQITSSVTGLDGETDAILAKISPVRLSKCTIQIGNAAPPLAGEVAYRRGRDAEVRQPLQNPPIVLELQPDDYSIVVQLTNGTVDPAKIDADLYEDQTLVFTNVAGLPQAPSVTGPPPAAGMAEGAAVDVVVPSDTTFELRNVNTGEEDRFNASKRISLRRGRYFATLRNKDDLVIKRQEVEVTPGDDVSLNLAEWRDSAPHRAIADKLPQQNGAVDFSESLHGAVTDTDLDLWLALLGGGRILGTKGGYSKIAQFPLHNFSDEANEATPIYVLAGFEDPATRLEVGLSRDADVAWSDAVEPRDMAGIREAYFLARPGAQLVSFRVADHPPYTVASLASANRAMLITLTLDDEGNPRLCQYLLPLGHLLDNLPSEVKAQLQGRNHLSDVRFIAQASRVFRKRRDLGKQLAEKQLAELLYAKWLDPIASSLAAYERLRRGKKKEMEIVVDNMKRFFPDIPDTMALAKLSGDANAAPNGVPLFLDGLRAFPDYTAWLPLPAGHLDFASPWTAWRAAVN
jgi:hypothetical protein